MTEDDLAGLHVLIRDENPDASTHEIAQLILLRLTEDQALDLATIALARDDTMDSVQSLAWRVILRYVESVDPGPKGNPGLSPA